jgi:hypothetical protein
MMARIATGVSKKSNRENLKGLELFWAWRNGGLVSEFNEWVSVERQVEIAQVSCGQEMRAIEFAVHVIKKGK